ncbi:MAG TPA: DNA polymerase III subunit chi [Alphaproteobacteria bacterium]|nr:DNA polymerase III subunit chi [Alphaproteobacteria bacterium]
MTLEVIFYGLTLSPLEKALPKLLEKVYESSKRALVIVESLERLQTLNVNLWTYSSGAFLPHLSDQDDMNLQEVQPILLSTQENFINKPTILVSTFEYFPKKPEVYEKILYVLDISTPQFLKSTQTLMKRYQDQGALVTFWKQSKEKGWEKS